MEAGPGRPPRPGGEEAAAGQASRGTAPTVHVVVAAVNQMGYVKRTDPNNGTIGGSDDSRIRDVVNGSDRLPSS